MSGLFVLDIRLSCFLERIKRAPPYPVVDFSVLDFLDYSSKFCIFMRARSNIMVHHAKHGRSYFLRNWFEERDAKNLHVRFFEELGATYTDLKYYDTAGKPGGKQRKQTSTYSIGRYRSTRLTSI